eukprot:7800577-Alexandrium_andersonii.AAC.1
MGQRGGVRGREAEDPRAVERDRTACPTQPKQQHPRHQEVDRLAERPGAPRRKLPALIVGPDWADQGHVTHARHELGWPAPRRFFSSRA